MPHDRVYQSQKVYGSGAVHTTPSTFFGLVKNGIRGVYHSVSRKHLESYLDEYAFRYKHRDDPAPMFKILLGNVRRLVV